MVREFREQRDQNTNLETIREVQKMIADKGTDGILVVQQHIYETEFANVYPPEAACNFFIVKAIDSNEEITHMKLQKLVYLSHEKWLKTNDLPFLATNPEVWQYGPVFSDLYRKLKSFRMLPIEKQITVNGETPTIQDVRIVGVMDSVWSTYGKKTAVQLSNITHETGTPWRNIAEKYNFCVPFGLEIKPNDIIDAVRKG